MAKATVEPTPVTLELSLEEAEFIEHNLGNLKRFNVERRNEVKAEILRALQEVLPNG